MDKNKLRTKIINLRKKTGLSQKEFSNEFGIPKRTIENWESGKNSPSKYLVKFMQCFIERWIDESKKAK